MQIIDDQGNICVYDQRGYLIPAEEYQPPKRSANRLNEDNNDDNDSNGAKEYREVMPRRPSSASIFTKTKRFVENVRNLRELAKSEIVGEEPWQPAKLPAATVAPNHVKVEVLPQNVIRRWPEYFRLKPLDVILTIEHCWCCHEHNEVTHHDEAKYRNVAKSIHDAIVQVAQQYNIRYYSLIKPIEFDDQLELSKNRRPKSAGGNKDEIRLTPQFSKKYVNVDYSNRIGAMEIQLAVKIQNQLVCHLLHSKLFSGLWPKLWTLQNLFEEVLELLGFEKATIMPKPPWAPKEALKTPVRKKSIKKSPSNGTAVAPLEQLFDYRNGRESNHETSTTAEKAEELIKEDREIVGRVFFGDTEEPINDGTDGTKKLSPLLDSQDVVDDTQSVKPDIINSGYTVMSPHVGVTVTENNIQLQVERQDNKTNKTNFVYESAEEKTVSNGTSISDKVLPPENKVVKDLPTRSVSTDALLQGNMNLKQEDHTSLLLRSQSEAFHYPAKNETNPRVSILPSKEPTDFQPSKIVSNSQSESTKRIMSAGDSMRDPSKMDKSMNDGSGSSRLDLKLTAPNKNPVSGSEGKRFEKKADNDPYSDLIRQFEEDLASFSVPSKPPTPSATNLNASPILPVEATVASAITMAAVSKDNSVSKQAKKEVGNFPTAEKAAISNIPKEINPSNSSHPLSSSAALLSSSKSEALFNPVAPPVPKESQSVSTLKQKTADLLLNNPTPIRVSEESKNGNKYNAAISTTAVPPMKATDLNTSAVIETVRIPNRTISPKHVSFDKNLFIGNSKKESTSSPSIASSVNIGGYQLSSIVVAAVQECRPQPKSSVMNNNIVTNNNAAAAIVSLESKLGSTNITPLSGKALLTKIDPNGSELPIITFQRTTELASSSIGHRDSDTPSVSIAIPAEKKSAPPADNTPTPSHPVSVSSPVSKPENIKVSVTSPEVKNEQSKVSEMDSISPEQMKVPVEQVPSMIAPKTQLLSAKDTDRIIKSYGSMCAYCEKPGIAADFQLDLIIPLSDGGDTSFTNFQPLYEECFAIANPGLDSPFNDYEEFSTNDVSVLSVVVEEQPEATAAAATTATVEDVSAPFHATVETIDSVEQDYRENIMLTNPSADVAELVAATEHLDHSSPEIAPPLDESIEIERNFPAVPSTSYSPSVSVHGSSNDVAEAAVQSYESIQIKEVETVPTSSSTPERYSLHEANDSGKKGDSIELPVHNAEAEDVGNDDDFDDFDDYNDEEFKLEIPVLFPNEAIRSSTPSPSVLPPDSSAVLTPQSSAAKLKDILKMNANKLNLLQSNLNKHIAEDDDDSSNDSDRYSKKEKRSEEDFWKDLVQRIDDD